MDASRPLRPSPHEDFAREVKAGVDAYFARSGLSRHADAAMVAKTVVLVCLYFGSYALIVSSLPPLPWAWALCLAMGIGMAGIGFSVTHDALHGAYSADPRVNRLLGHALFAALGANPYIWRLTHNHVHHTYPNVQGYDEDLEVSPLIRLSPHTPHKPIHRFRHVFAFLAYGFATLFWVFVKDYKYFLMADLGPYRGRKHPRSEWLLLFLGKASYYFMMIGLPLLVLEIAWWQFLVGFLTLHLSAGLILGVVFQLAHVVEPTGHLRKEEAGPFTRASWMVHQMRTTSNFAPGNRLLSWYVGGLNHQIEHHLFPRVCHVHYGALSPIVEAAAARHGVPYHRHATLWQAVRSHHRVLKAYGDPVLMGAAVPQR
ncbi:MAG TPA: acyl-CoA desaturase [Geminicoccaceae bacterium]|nr:acyl-CoA desaturase [Geminicoccaceae bacterium]